MQGFVKCDDCLFSSACSSTTVAINFDRNLKTSLNNLRCFTSTLAVHVTTPPQTIIIFTVREPINFSRQITNDFAYWSWPIVFLACFAGGTLLSALQRYSWYSRSPQKKLNVKVPQPVELAVAISLSLPRPVCYIIMFAWIPVKVYCYESSGPA